MFVRGVIIQDQVQVAVGGRFRIDLLEKFEPFLVTMTVLALPDQGAVGDI